MNSFSPYENSVAKAEPFFVLDDVIEAARNACIQARHTAWEYRGRGQITDYRRKVADAWYWRRRARLWALEQNMETVIE